MKIAIVVAAILIAAWVAILAIRPDLVRPALAKKSDIYGLAPGMTSEEVDKLITQRKYRCRQVQDAVVIDCIIEGNRVSIALDGADDKRFVRRITAEIASDRGPEATVRADLGTVRMPRRRRRRTETGCGRSARASSSAMTALPLRCSMNNWMARAARSRLIHLDVGGLDDRPPFRDFGLLPGAERFRRRAGRAGGICRPRFSSCLRTAGSSSASTAAALSFAMISFGVPFGTQSPDHSVMWKPGRPASSTVGMSGADCDALGVGDGIGADLAGADLADRVGGLVDDDVDLAGDEIVQRRGRCRDTARIAA